VVSPRSLPGSVGLPSGGGPGVVESGSTDSVRRLAERWARLGPSRDPRTAERLTVVLHKLAALVRSEPFWPFAARALGAELLDSELCGPADGFDGDALGLVEPSRRLLRVDGPTALDATRPDSRRRLLAAVEELLAGLVGMIQQHGRTPDATVPQLHLRAVTDQGLRAAYEQAHVGVGVAELDGVLVDINPALRKMFAIAGSPAPRPLSDYVHPDDVADLVDRLQRLLREESEVLRIELRLVRCDGSVFWAHVTGSRVLDDSGEPSYLLMVVEDVTERHRKRSRLEEATYQDQLTRLPNRTVAEQWLLRAVAPGARTRVGVCTLDIDGFGLVNDTHGQQVGDRLLLAVAGRLQVAAAGHLVTRTGADEFTVLVADPRDVDEVHGLADRLLATMAMPFTVGGATVNLSASIGVAEGSTLDTCAAEFLRGSDVARSWAKVLGGGRAVVFDPQRDAAEAARYALLSGMRGAIGRGEFRLAFQPLVRLSDGKLRGAEALVRWQHPEQGLLAPGRFIALAEYSGAIVPLGRWILEVACAQAADWWRDLGPDAPYVSVNVSPVQLAEPGWLGDVKEVLEATGLPAEKLQLEITEQAVLGEDAAPLDALTALRSAGVQLALDDFGTGYSSLAWLRRLPVHALKIDGSFIEGLRSPDPDPTDSSIVRALVGMAHALGLEVTAEWVQTGLQADRLAELGCDFGQGEHFGQAGPGEWVPELYRRSIAN